MQEQHDERSDAELLRVPRVFGETVYSVQVPHARSCELFRPTGTICRITQHKLRDLSPRIQDGPRGSVFSVSLYLVPRHERLLVDGDHSQCAQSGTGVVPRVVVCGKLNFCVHKHRISLPESARREELVTCRMRCTRTARRHHEG